MQFEAEPGAEPTESTMRKLAAFPRADLALMLVDETQRLLSVPVSPSRARSEV